MASWSTTTKHETTEINGGQKYELGDQVSLEGLNAIVENSLYAINNPPTGIEKVETIYDMDDSSNNLGYPSGMQGGITINTPSLSKYKLLRIYANYKTRNQLFATINLTKSNSNGDYVGGNMQPTFETNENNAVWIGCAVVSGKGQVAFTFGTFSTSKTIDNANGRVYKIEGVY